MDENKQKQKHPIIYYIDAILLIILLTVVIFAQVKGAYIDKEVKVIEVCNNNPTPTGLQTLEELGWTPQQLNNYQNKYNQQKNN